MSDMVDREVIEQLRSHGHDSEDLDEIIHAVKSQEATAINNAGFEAQISFLLADGWSAAEILDRLENK